MYEKYYMYYKFYMRNVVYFGNNFVVCRCKIGFIISLDCVSVLNCKYGRSYFRVGGKLIVRFMGIFFR